MTEEEAKQQEALHATLAQALPLDDGHVLTGWILVYEGMGPDDERYAGHFYGPRTMTTWGSMGLVEWARTRSLTNMDNDDDD